ncbi:hypothetical protein [Lactobacillus amylovorus]|uniref:hypothetical protein n=1 Tax=Lactobacillus amylovorus TaxID=1604 RepID=UPI0023311F63|nr:hypothetical protein [Lactobacillus amylovorus]MDB6222683.1 hypothetical protein [Lactobacillus amylovorus]MDB6232419.1 hypothetical protein [Lactobacillus amylovorus]
MKNRIYDLILKIQLVIGIVLMLCINLHVVHMFKMPKLVYPTTAQKTYFWRLFGANRWLSITIMVK